MLISRHELVATSALIGAGLGIAQGVGRAALAQNRPALPIPPEIRPDTSGEIHLTSQIGSMNFIDAGPTPTYGVNGNYLGPAVRVRRGENVTMRVTNALDQNTTMHWHGLEVSGEYDGGPHNAIAAGHTWTAYLPIDQPTATLWYHPHYYPTTAEQVLKGVAGLFIIDDDESNGLDLPSDWGIDDIPIIIQDRRFNSDGSFFHRFNLMAVTTGYIGDTVLVNGAFNPVATTAKGWLRLRILNGSNARTYRLKASDNRSLYVIGCDGGLLSEPVEVSELPVFAGERYEVLVDARDGMPFDLLTVPVSQMGMNLPPFHEALSIMSFDPSGAEASGTLPDRLVSLPALDPNLPAVSQNLVMGMRLDDQGMGLMRAAGLMAMNQSGVFDPSVVDRVVSDIVDGPVFSIAEQLSANTINDRSFEFFNRSFQVPIQQNLRWLISEGTDNMVHPVHIHGCQFRILNLDGAPPPAYIAGWKDMAPISMGGTCEIQVRFNYPAPEPAPYMIHCHILEHEDSGMMTQFNVV